MTDVTRYTIYIGNEITTHEAHDEGNHPAMVPAGNIFL